MKKIFKTLAIVAVAALGFACQNEIDEQVNGNEGEKVTVEVVGTVADLTRSVFGDTPNTQSGTVSSTWRGDETVGFSVNGAALVLAENTEAGDTASFSVEFDEIKSNDVVYAFSPAATFGEIAEGVIAVNIPATQTPSSATSVAENVHLLAANATYKGGAMTMNFGHIAAYGKMNITGFEGEIASVAITFPNGVAGACEYDYVNKAWSGATEKTITLNGNQSSYWFGIAPTVVDDNITIVVAANGKTYTKKLYTAGKLEFIKGQVSNFTVNMAGVKEDVKVIAPETIVFADCGYTNQQVITSTEGENFSVTFTNGGTKTQYYTTGAAVRVYAEGTFTVSSETTIAEIVLTYGSGDKTNAITTNVGTFSTDTWTGSSNSVTFTVGGTKDHRRIASITVTFGAATAEDTRDDQTLVFACEGEVDPNQTLILYAAENLQQQFVQPTLSGNKSFTKYSSSNEQIATVDSEGNVTIVATKTGNATITATAVEDGDYKAAQATYTITIVEPTLTGVSGNGIWAANNIDEHEFTLAGEYLDQTEISYNTLEYFDVALIGTTLTVTPKAENETEEDIVETLTVTIPTGDEQSVTLTHNAPIATNLVYKKVTEAPDDWSGTYLIVYEDGFVAFDGGLTTLDAASNTVVVEITTGTMTIDPSTVVGSEFVIAKSGSNYTIKSASGYYIGQTTDANGLKSSTSTTYTNTLSINNDDTVNVVSSGGAYLRYNATSGQERFRYFKSGTYSNQKAICLYKLVEK